MQMKRLIILAVSTLVAAAGTWLTVYVFFQTDLEKFALSNDILLFVSIFCIVGIWLDYFLDTKILRS